MSVSDGTAVVVIVCEYWMMVMSGWAIHQLECIHHNFDNMTVVYWNDSKKMND